MPLKGDVARQITYDKDAMKICEKLNQKNDKFCAVEYCTLKYGKDEDWYLINHYCIE